MPYSTTVTRKVCDDNTGSFLQVCEDADCLGLIEVSSVETSNPERKILLSMEPELALQLAAAINHCVADLNSQSKE